MSTQKNNRTAEARADSPAHGSSEVWIGHNEPNTRGLAQDMQHSMIEGESYTLTADEVMAAYLSLARLHDLEDFGYRRDWEGIKSYCPRTDDPQNRPKLSDRLGSAA